MRAGWPRTPVEWRAPPQRPTRSRARYRLSCDGHRVVGERLDVTADEIAASHCVALSRLETLASMRMSPALPGRYWGPVCQRYAPTFSPVAASRVASVILPLWTTRCGSHSLKQPRGFICGAKCRRLVRNMLLVRARTQPLMLVEARVNAMTFSGSQRVTGSNPVSSTRSARVSEARWVL